ncbi:MAG: ATP-binding protein [Pseudonocardiales bacterium]|nr:ATP-binding protein [Pseudonocardiales bacterium]
MSHDLMIGIREEPDHVILRLRGRLSLQNVPRVREATVKSLLGTGRVLIDLSRLRSSPTTFVTVFPAALAVAGGWPSARLVLFGANAAIRTTLLSARIPETVPLAADLPSARALLQQRPPQVRRHRDLPLHNTAPAAARLLVRESCALWSVPQTVREIAELISSELVSNAVEHAHSSSRLTLTCTTSALRISVRDYRPAPIPRPRPLDIGAPRGRGLHLVAALAQTWGTNQHPDGKTIWATVPFDSRQ